MINAKEYLSKLERLEVMIQQKKAEVEDLKLIATSSGGFSSDEIVKSSKKGDTLEKKVIKYVDIEKEIDKDIDRYVKLKHKIINEIQSLNDTEDVKLLYKRYVERKRLKRIAKEMHYDDGTIRNKHLKALDAFQEEVLSKLMTQNDIHV